LPARNFSGGKGGTMAQLWTIIFVTLLAITFGLAAWQDREDAKRRERRNTVVEKKDSPNPDS
jgi:cytochrome oxidase assembly protein ShyY1